ncbi:MAG: carbohydrate kinase, partial [Christensenella sp.]|nr:carbohydrate kinase [Christensenella sp.]
MNMPLIMGEGGAQSRIWRQIISDALGIPGIYMSNSMGAPVGDAILAGVGAGVFKDCNVVKDWVKLSDETEPDAKNHEIYNDMYKIYRELYEQVKDSYKDLVPLVKKIDARKQDKDN